MSGNEAEIIERLGEHPLSHILEAKQQEWSRETKYRRLTFMYIYIYIQTVQCKDMPLILER